MTAVAPAPTPQPRDPWFPAPGDPLPVFPRGMEPVIRARFDFSEVLKLNIALGGKK